MAINRNSLSEQIYTQLREDILTGRIPQGQKLTLRELQDRFEVSSTPVREALTRLAQDRLVDYVTNQGAKVVELTEEDVRNLLELGCLYDCYAAEKILREEKVLQEAAVAALRAALERQSRYIDHPQEQKAEYGHIFGGFHEVLYTCTGNAWLLYSALQNHGLLYLADIQLGGQNYPQEALNEHRAILDALAGGDLPGTLERIRSHREHERRRFGV